MVVHTFLFFLRAKTHRGGQDAETQRNYGALGLTFRRGGQASFFAPSLLCELFFFLLYSRKDAETQRNYGALGLTFRRGGQASLLCAFPTLQPAPQNCGAPNTFCLLAMTQSPVRRGGQAQRNCSPPLGSCF